MSKLLRKDKVCGSSAENSFSCYATMKTLKIIVVADILFTLWLSIYKLKLKKNKKVFITTDRYIPMFNR